MDLLLLQGQLLFLHDLRTLVAGLKICTTLVQVLASGLGRLILIFLYRDALTNLRQLDLVLDFSDTYQLLLIWLVPHGNPRRHHRSRRLRRGASPISSRDGLSLVD